MPLPRAWRRSRAALLLWGALAWVVRQPPFAFREVVVRGPLEHVNAAHLEAVVRDELAGTFFTMNLESARPRSLACRGCAASRCAGSGRSGSN